MRWATPHELRTVEVNIHTIGAAKQTCRRLATSGSNDVAVHVLRAQDFRCSRYNWSPITRSIPTSGVKRVIKTGIVAMALIPQIIWKPFKSHIRSQRMSQRPIRAKKNRFCDRYGLPSKPWTHPGEARGHSLLASSAFFRRKTTDLPYFFTIKTSLEAPKYLFFWLHCCKRPGIQLSDRWRWSKNPLNDWFAR
jgi:hypothetical protein